MSEQQLQPRILELTRFGNPILREKAQRIGKSAILSPEIQSLINNIRYTNQNKQYGMGLAAPQVGYPLALSVIGIKPTPNRPHLEPFDQVIINPSYEGIGRRKGMWEGCQSAGSGNDILFGKVLRYTLINASWVDENGHDQQKKLEGIVAHVFQHETDHLDGILFVDRVKDSTTYMMADEYRKRIVGVAE